MEIEVGVLARLSRRSSKSSVADLFTPVPLQRHPHLQSATTQRVSFVSIQLFRSCRVIANLRLLQHPALDPQYGTCTSLQHVDCNMKAVLLRRPTSIHLPSQGVQKVVNIYKRPNNRPLRSTPTCTPDSEATLAALSVRVKTSLLLVTACSCTLQRLKKPTSRPCGN